MDCLLEKRFQVRLWVIVLFDVCRLFRYEHIISLNMTSVRRRPKRLCDTEDITPGSDSAVIDTSRSVMSQNRPKDSQPKTTAFEFDATQFLVDLNTRCIQRPLPAIHTMLSAAPQPRKSVHAADQSSSGTKRQADEADDEEGRPATSSQTSPPLLLSFISELRGYLGVKDNNNVADAESEGNGGGDKDHDSGEIGLWSLEDQKYSTLLTRAHHKRFRKLLSIYGTNRNENARLFMTGRGNIGTKKQRNEFEQLCELFREERRLYGEALRDFYMAHAARFHLGFKVSCESSQFTGIRSQYIDSYQKCWLASSASRAQVYGPCIQTISVHHVASSGGHTVHQVPQITVDTLSPNLVFQRNVNGDLPIVSLEELRHTYSIGSSIQHSSSKRILRDCCSSAFLSDDLEAKRLAGEYNAQVVLTDRVMESLIKASRWVLPVSQQTIQGKNRSSVVVFMDDPLPSPCGPREALSFGFVDSIYGGLLENQRMSNDHNVPRQYNYTVLKFLGASPSPFRVLVRSEAFVLCEEGGGPLCMDVSLEYFPGRGMELIPTRDRTYWLVQKILHPNSKQILFRIDPETAKILSMEEKGIADALTSEDPAKDEKGTKSLSEFENMEEGTTSDLLLQSLMDFCFAMTKLQHDCSRRNMICYPARYHSTGTSVLTQQVASVHQESVDTTGPIHVMHELDHAHQVHLTPSFRPWSWNHDRMPYTFALQEDNLG